MVRVEVPRSRHRFVLAVALAIGLASAACSDDDDAADPSSSGSDVGSDVATETTSTTSTTTTVAAEAAEEPETTAAPVFVDGPCPGEPFERTEGVRCGTVAVPADPQDPTAGEVVLTVAHVPPTGDAPLTDAPVLRLQGGPGGGIVSGVGGWADWDQRNLFGVVLLDYRGELESDPFLDCPEKADALITNVTTFDDFRTDAERIRDGARLCAERAAAAGVDLRLYDTERIADDIEVVRVALGVERWNLIGVSYGTTTAMEVMRRHPETVRSVILDSAYPPERFTIEDVVGGLDHMLAEFDRSCPPGSSCNPGPETLSERFFAIVEQLDAEPLEGTFTDPRTGEPITAQYDGGDVANALWLAVWSGNAVPTVATTLLDDPGPGLASLLAIVAESQYGELDAFALLQADVVECRDRGHRNDLDSIVAAVEARPELKGIFQYATYVGHGITCDVLDAGAVDAAWTDSLVSDLPTLVLAGRWDAVTPPSWGEALLAGLPNGTFVEYPGLAHGTWDETACSFAITQQFLADPGAELDTACVADMPDHFDEVG